MIECVVCPQCWMILFSFYFLCSNNLFFCCSQLSDSLVLIVDSSTGVIFGRYFGWDVSFVTCG